MPRINERLDAEAAPLWKARHKPEVMERLCEIYREFSEKIAHVEHRKNNHRSIELDELFCAANLGLCKAIRKYDPNSPAAFTSFAFWAVRGAVIDVSRQHDWVPHTARDLEKKGHVEIPLLLPLDPISDDTTGRKTEPILNLEESYIPLQYHRPLKNIVKHGIERAAKLEHVSIGQLQAVLARPLMKAMCQQGIV